MNSVFAMVKLVKPRSDKLFQKKAPTIGISQKNIASDHLLNHTMWCPRGHEIAKLMAT